MPKYIITTLEDVAGTYSVEAENEDKARESFNGTPRKLHEAMDEGLVEQIDYMAFSIELERMTKLP